MYSPLGWWSNEIMEMPLFEKWKNKVQSEQLFEHEALVLLFSTVLQTYPALISAWRPLCHRCFQAWPPFRYLSAFQIMYFSRCTFLLFQADLICSFPAHISNLSTVALCYVSCSPVYSTILFTLICRCNYHNRFIASFLAINNNAKWNVSEADCCSIFLGLAACHFSFFFFFFSQRWGHFSWFREPPNPTKAARFGLVLVIWEADLVFPDHNKISDNMPTHEVQSVGSFPISPASHQCEGTPWDSVCAGPETRRTHVFRVEFQSLVFLSSKNLQPSSSINLRNRVHNLWGSLQRKRSLVFLNNLADIRVASLLPLLYLAVCKEKGVGRRKRAQRLSRGWMNLRNRFDGTLSQTIFFSS